VALRLRAQSNKSSRPVSCPLYQHTGGSPNQADPPVLNNTQRFLLPLPPRFSRIFIVTVMGVPSKPNSSRMRRSMNRR
jgi:hypothetical protein